jgi:hypothetical protein
VSFFHYRGARSLEAGVKYGTAATPSVSPTVGGGDEEDVGASDAGGRRDSNCGAWRRGGESGEGHRSEEAERSLRERMRRSEIYFFYLERRRPDERSHCIIIELLLLC